MKLMLMIKLNILVLFLAFFATRLYCYTVTDFNNESSSLLALENKMIKSIIPSFIDMRIAEPFVPDGGYSFSSSISYGTAISPFFAYNLPDTAGYMMFRDQTNIYDGYSEFAPAFSLNNEMKLPDSLYSAFNLSFMPGLYIGNATNYSFKLNLNLYYKICDQESSWISILAGGGYAYTAGSVNRGLNLSYSDSSGQAFYTGGFFTGWNYNVIDADFMAYKTVYSFLTLYGKAAYYYINGSVTSQLNGEFNAGNVNITQSDNTPGYGVELSAGMKITYGGRFNFSVESGRDWENQSIYADCGFGMGF